MANEKNLTEETTEVVTEGVTENTGAEGTTEPEGTEGTAPEGTTEPEGTEGSEDVAGEEVEDETEDSGSKVLVAVYPILFQSHQYKVGDTLPANYPDMVDAWLEAGTAVWKTVETAAPKARPATAEPGLAGAAVTSASENGEDLVGKVPKTTKRSKK